MQPIEQDPFITPVDTYRKALRLDEPFIPPHERADSPQQRATLVAEVLEVLLTPAQRASLHQPIDYAQQRVILQSLLTSLSPEQPLPDWVKQKLGILLQTERSHKLLTETTELQTIQVLFPESGYPAAGQCCLWQGNITQLACDAIVNAANAQLLGCFQPFHRCIDNAIGCGAGPELREDCYTLMQAQGQPEATGTAKITRAYHLPARYVIHTVGPIVERGAAVTDEQRAQLASCYRACLTITQAVSGIRSVAFCCLSTGVFGFPVLEAAPIALQTVADWLGAHPGTLDRVVFNVFSERDEEMYSHYLTNWP